MCSAYINVFSLQYSHPLPYTPPQNERNDFWRLAEEHANRLEVWFLGAPISLLCLSRGSLEDLSLHSRVWFHFLGVGARGSWLLAGANRCLHVYVYSHESVCVCIGSLLPWMRLVTGWGSGVGLGAMVTHLIAGVRLKGLLMMYNKPYFEFWARRKQAMQSLCLTYWSMWFHEDIESPPKAISM